jgi:hypothetical protein
VKNSRHEAVSTRQLAEPASHQWAVHYCAAEKSCQSHILKLGHTAALGRCLQGRRCQLYVGRPQRLLVAACSNPPR